MTLLIWLAASSLAWGAVLWIAGRLLQRSSNVSGRARQWFWRGATALLVAPWLATPFVILFGLGLAPPETTALATVATAATGDNLAAMHVLDLAHDETAVIENGGSIMAWLAAANPLELALLVVMAGWLVRFVMAQHALKSLLGIVNMSHAAAPGAATGFVANWTRRLKLRREPRLLVTQEQHSPFSFGIVRPTICLPDGLEDRLSKESLDLVVGHECLHVARGDGWLRPLERVTADIFWFNPFAWLIRRELDVARELAVDEAVIEMASSRLVYARALRDVAGFSAGLSTAAPAASMSLAGGRSLMLRVTRTLSQAKRKPARAAILAACLLGVVGAPLAVAQVMLAVPAPPAPPEAPTAPDAPEFAAIEPIEPLATFEAPEAPEAPQAPEAPPAAEFSTRDGKVHVTFPAKVVSLTGDATKGFRVELLQTVASDTGDICHARMDGLGSIAVAKGDVIAKGEVVGGANKTRPMSFTVTCSDDLDSNGYPKAGPPPAAPAAPSFPGEAIAPPAPPAAPSPVAAPAPVAPPSPASPVSAIAPTPPTPPTPMVRPTPLIAPTPPTPSAWQNQPAPPAPPAPLKTPITLDGAPGAVILAPARISGQYGARLDPINQQPAFHTGVDIAAAKGVLVHSPVNGRVAYAGVLGASGNTVQVRTSADVTVTFAQMDEIKVKVGDTINAGAVVGTVGSSGRSTGSHLHLEVARNGQQQDPETVSGLVLIGQH